MPKTRFIAEIGSSHGGTLEGCRKALDAVIEIGADAMKFQLFPNEERFTKSGNVYLKPEIYQHIALEAKEKGIEIGASVFDADSLDFLISTEPDFIKFAYSQKEQKLWIMEAIRTGIETIVSCDMMSKPWVPEKAKTLFCLPFYPVYYEVSFENLFPHFDGFSDHTLGTNQTFRAVAEGAGIVEKHLRLTDVPKCPDDLFAISKHEFRLLVEESRRVFA